MVSIANVTWGFVHTFCLFETDFFYFTTTVAQAFARCRFVITTCVWASANVDTIACSASEEH